mmetsp:Transcript_105706/g.305854  ORF Transcript_105706/g.305854 Transcript_105706/m.305854 type:complete len:215 (-) Transcript_105706:723-1367(-)
MRGQRVAGRAPGSTDLDSTRDRAFRQPLVCSGVVADDPTAEVVLLHACGHLVVPLPLEPSLARAARHVLPGCRASEVQRIGELVDERLQDRRLGLVVDQRGVDHHLAPRRSYGQVDAHDVAVDLVVCLALAGLHRHRNGSRHPVVGRLPELRYPDCCGMLCLLQEALHGEEPAAKGERGHQAARGQREDVPHPRVHDAAAHHRAHVAQPVAQHR